MAARRKKKSSPTDTRAPAVPLCKQSKTANIVLDKEALSGMQNRPAAHTSDSLQPAGHEDGWSMTAEDIHKIFQFSHTGYTKKSNHTRNEKVRERSNYQKHLDPDLHLNQVTFSPSLPMELAKIAANHLEKYKAKCGETPLCMETTPSLLFNALRKRQVRMETGIMEGYAEMAKRILPIATALLFQTPSIEGLKWSMELPQNGAIPDVALMVDGDAPLPDQLRDVAELFPHFLPYEFKNLNFGTPEYMMAITEKSCDDKVEWTACTVPCLDHGITGHRTGFDARQPVVSLTVTDWKDTEAAHSLDTCKPKLVFKPKHSVAAKDITEQLWSELVRNDATFIVLNAGNYEQICYRNRAERKLYLSGPIDTRAQYAGVGYVQVHIGLFIASLLDAIDRATYIKTCERTNYLPHSWTSYQGGRRKFDEVMLNKTEVDLEQVLFKCSAVALLSTVKPPASNSSYVLGEEYHRYPQLHFSGGAGAAGPVLGIKIQHRYSDTYIGSIINLAGRSFSNCVSIKTACGKNSVRDLLLEYSKYLSLENWSSSCRVPITYGFFRRNDPPYAFLLQEHVGEPLYLTVGWLSDEQQNDALRSLDGFHAKNYKHGNLSDRTIIIGKRKREVYLGGLERMGRASEDERVQERQELIGLFREFKRQRDKGPTVLIGPIHDTSDSPQKVFSEVMAEMEAQEICTPASELLNCLGWSGDWLEVELAKCIWRNKFELLHKAIRDIY